MPARPEERVSGAAAGRELVSAKLARRIALAAAGFGDRRPPAVSSRHLGRVIGRLGLLQIDAVNVLARAQYVPVFSRLGPYPTRLLDQAAYGRRRSLFEYWGHEASLLRLDLQPLLRWRMAEARAGRGIYGGLARFASERMPFIEDVLRRVESHGPTTAGELAEGGRARSSWWGWSDGKRALEWLFWAGLVTTRERRGFARVYDLSERVLPPTVLAQPTPEPAEAHRGLIRLASRALGIATEPDLRDYFRLGPAASKTAVATLVESGELLPVKVEGWSAPAFLEAGAARPRRIDARALLSPFDPLIWERARTERLFGFRYRLEIYTPAHKRAHGYYVLPFLLGERIAGRVDLKADRPGGRLVVRALHLEPSGSHEETRRALATELESVAGWLGLGETEWPRAG